MNLSDYEKAAAALDKHAAADWPEPCPLPNELPPVQKFKPAMLPAALRGWVADIADRMQCPPDFLAVGAVTALSSLIGAKVCISPKERDDWRVTPNLWGLVVGRPGAMKSPALSEVLRPLHRLEANEREAHAEAMAEWEAHNLARELEQKSREREAAKKAGKIDRTALAEMLRQDAEEPQPAQRRLIASDCTVEALAELMRGNPWGLLAFRDELYGLLASMDREGQEGARAFYLTGWNGDAGFTVDRIGRGLGMHIERVCLSVLGGIQPGRLQSLVRGAVEGGAGDDGLLQRFQLAVWPDDAGEWVNVDRWPDTEHRQAAAEVFDRLHALPCPPEDAPAWRFNHDAQAIFTEWRTDFENRLRSDELHPAMESHLSKFRKLVPALALVFELVDNPQGAAHGDPGQVGKEALMLALEWACYLESHAERIYFAAKTPETAAANALLRRIQRGDVEQAFNTRTLARKCWSQLTTPEAVRKACQVLAEYGWMRRDERTTGPSGGRPSEWWELSPRINEALS